MPYVQESLKMMDRLKSPYLGFTIDTGIFCRRHPRVSTNYFKTIGLNNEYIISYMMIFSQGEPIPTPISWRIRKLKKS